MGVHPHAPMKGVQSPCPLCPWGPHAAERGDPTCDEAQRALIRSRASLAPRAAGRAEVRSTTRQQRRVCALASITRAGARRERSCALCACGGPSGQRTRLRLGGRYFGIRGLPLLPVYRRRGYRSPGYMLPLAGRGYDKQGGYIKPHKDGTSQRSES